MVTKQKILIVDDDNNIAELISLYLTKECFETRIVNDGEQALKDFASFQPDLILLDLMPVSYTHLVRWTLFYCFLYERVILRRWLFVISFYHKNSPINSNLIIRVIF